jgi:CRP/FNR family transcriptional regulator, cyclic AMP receptor protein
MAQPLLSAIGDDDAQLLLAQSHRRRFDRGEVVFHRGDPADTLHVIVQGRFAVYIATPLGDRAMLSVLGPRDAFGELALVRGGQRSATVSALEPGETRALHQAEFARLRTTQPRLTKVLLELVAARVERLSEQVVEALYAPAEERIVHRLAELAEAYGARGEATATIPLRQDQLAELAGTTRVTANQVLHGLQARGAVSLGRGRIVVQPERLPRRRTL